jgi:hypothetical protein
MTMLNFDRYSLLPDGALDAMWLALDGQDGVVAAFADRVTAEIPDFTVVTPDGPGWVLGAFAAHVASGGALRPADRALITHLLKTMNTNAPSDAGTTVLQWFALTTAARLMPDSDQTTRWTADATAIVQRVRQHSFVIRDGHLFAIDPTAVLAGVFGFPLNHPRGTVGGACWALEKLRREIDDSPMQPPVYTERTIDMLQILGVIGLAGVGVRHLPASALAELQHTVPMASYGRLPDLARAAVGGAPLHVLISGPAR